MTLESPAFRHGECQEREARENCEREAEQYDAIESGVEPTRVEEDWICKFKFWS